MRIGIIGTGRLGLCMSLCLDAYGFDVTCYDINKSLLHDIKNKVLDTNEPAVKTFLKTSTLNIANTEEEIIGKCDVIFVFIQTPSLHSGEYDHTFINGFVDKCINICENTQYNDNKIIVISSTVMPEYTDSIIKKFKDRNILNIDVCYNPTFIAQGSIIENLMNPELILIGGYSDSAMNIIASIHYKIVQKSVELHKMSPLEAEITKISINCFITTKIAFANMVGDLLISKNIVPNKVLNAIGSDSRIGNKYLGYGYGFGGPCFPRDNKALYSYASKKGFAFHLCKTTDELNNDHLQYQYKIMKETAKDIEFTYITYKDTSDILEESQKLKLAVMLADAGFKVTIKERAHIIEKLMNIYGNRKFIYHVL